MTPLELIPKVQRRAREAVAHATQWAVEHGALPGGRDYKRFVVLCAIRTGSTMLGTYLGSHPNVRMFFELFHRHPHSVPFDVEGYRARANNPSVVHDRNSDPAGFLERHVFTRHRRWVKAVGFKLLYTQARMGPQWWDEPKFDRWWAHLDRNKAPDWDAGTSDLWASLASDPAVHVIHLTRENPLAGMVSAELAKQTGRWGIGATGGAGRETDEATVTLRPEHVLQDLDAGLRMRQEGEAVFAGHPLTHVTYEELVEAPDAALANLQTFLGLPPAQLRTRTVKQNRRPLCDVIENYDALAEALRGTRWASLLSDEPS